MACVRDCHLLCRNKQINNCLVQLVVNAQVETVEQGLTARELELEQEQEARIILGWRGRRVTETKDERWVEVGLRSRISITGRRAHSRRKDDFKICVQ